MKTLTKIEKLDAQFPGLANQVRMWFDRGVHVRKVVELLYEHYQVCVPRSTVGNFRARYWARECEGREAKFVAGQALLEISRDLKMRDCPETPTAGLEAKIRLLLKSEVGSHFKPVGRSQARG